MADINSTFQVTIQGLPQLLAALKNEPSIAKPILNDAIHKAQAILAKYTTRGNVPWKTGNLASTFQPNFGDLMATWQPTAAYAPYVEFGHSQQPGRYVPALGKRLVASFVQGQPFMEKILAASQSDIDALFTSALQIIVRDIATAASSGV